MFLPTSDFPTPKISADFFTNIVPQNLYSPNFKTAQYIFFIRPINRSNYIKKCHLIKSSAGNFFIVVENSSLKVVVSVTAVFIPGLSPPDKCRNKAGQLNPPICLAWSSPARNHYIPLVPIKDCEFNNIFQIGNLKYWKAPSCIFLKQILYNF